MPLLEIEPQINSSVIITGRKLPVGVPKQVKNKTKFSYLNSKCYLYYS